MYCTLNDKPLSEVVPELLEIGDVIKNQRKKYQKVFSNIKEHQNQETKQTGEFKTEFTKLQDTILNGKSKIIGFQYILFHLEKIIKTFEALSYVKFKKLKFTNKTSVYKNRLLRWIKSNHRPKSLQNLKKAKVTQTDIQIINQQSQTKEASSTKSQKIIKKRPGRPKKEKSPISSQSERGKFKCSCQPNKTMKFSEYVMHKKKYHKQHLNFETQSMVSYNQKCTIGNKTNNKLLNSQNGIKKRCSGNLKGRKIVSYDISSDTGSWMDSQID